MKMTSLAEIQKEICNQLIRDYSKRSPDEVKLMLYLGLAEEAGEVAGLMKRVLRNFPKDQERTVREYFVEELGDVLWYLTACALSQGIELEEIWEYNIKKLKERYGE